MGSGGARCRAWRFIRHDRSRINLLCALRAREAQTEPHLPPPRRRAAAGEVGGDGDGAGQSQMRRTQLAHIIGGSEDR